MLRIIKAAITPGIQPASVNKKVIIMDPHPLSMTAKGGKIITKITRKQLIEIYFWVKLFCIFICRIL